jgi:hypothetical protein
MGGKANVADTHPKRFASLTGCGFAYIFLNPGPSGT